jgi:hypothetical protein
MKHVALILVSSLLSLTLFAQGKLVKSSDPKEPIWLNKKVEKHEAVKVRAESAISLEDAEKNAFSLLRAQVVQATVQYLYKFTPGEKDINKITKEVENSSYVRNISEAASLDTYWEIRFDRRSKKNHYNYNILYYFNEMEMKKIALEINQSKTSTAIDF